jgi:hypothetical protein
MYCLVSSRAFRRSPICCHCAGMRNITHTGALCSHGTKTNHNSSTQPRTQPHTVSDSTIRPCLLLCKSYGCNNAKPPWPPHRNTMIGIVVLGCDPIRTGEGAAAPFIGVHILGQIRPAGGFDTLAESRREDQIGPFYQRDI